MNTDEEKGLNILRQLKAAKESGNTSGLFPGNIKSFEGFNEFDHRDRQKVAELLRGLEGKGFVSRDQTVNRSTGYQITDRGDRHLSHGTKRES
jgi:hypothetical protein